MQGEMFFKKIKPADFVFVGFVVLASVVQFYYHHDAYTVKILIPYYIIAAVYIAILIALPLDSKHPTVILIKDWQPVVTVLATFFSLPPLVNNANPVMFDDNLIRADYFLFGTQPSFFLQYYFYPFLVDMSQLFYTFFYFFPAIVGVIIYRQQDKVEFEKVSLMILLTFYASFIGYMLFPAIGPRFTLAHQYLVDIKGLWFGNQLIDFLNQLEGPMKKNCFPSQHTGGALISIAVLYKYNRKLFWSFLVWPVMIVWATIYLRYHYFVDLIAGVINATIALWVAPFLVDRWDALALESRNLKEKAVQLWKI